MGGSALVLAADDAAGPATVKVCVGKRKTVVSANRTGHCPPGSLLTRINKQGPAGPTGTGLPGAAGPSGVPGASQTTGATATVEPPQTTQSSSADAPSADSSLPAVIDGGAP